MFCWGWPGMVSWCSLVERHNGNIHVLIVALGDALMRSDQLLAGLFYQESTNEGGLTQRVRPWHSKFEALIPDSHPSIKSDEAGCLPFKRSSFKNFSSTFSFGFLLAQIIMGRFSSSWHSALEGRNHFAHTGWLFRLRAWTMRRSRCKLIPK